MEILKVIHVPWVSKNKFLGVALLPEPEHILILWCLLKLE